MNRFNRYLETGEKPGEAEKAASQGQDQQKGKGKGKGKVKEESWLDTLHAQQKGYTAGETSQKHTFEVRTLTTSPWSQCAGLISQTELVPAKATPETFELYKQYQISVHNDKPEKISMRGFSRFLCDSPLGVSPWYTTSNLGLRAEHQNQAIKYSNPAPNPNLPQYYGSYHLRT